MSKRKLPTDRCQEIDVKEKMSKTNSGQVHYLIIFLEPSEDSYFTPLKIGKRFFNRLAIDENAGFEILSVLNLKQSSWKMTYPEHNEYKDFEVERKTKETVRSNYYSSIERTELRGRSKKWG